MSDRTPLKFEFDSTTPSSLAEFTSSDTVPELNGGTGVSSLALFGGSVSSISAVDLSAVTISSPLITGGTIDGSITGTFTGTTVSATTSVSSAAVSGETFNGMPYPPPFAYIQLTSDDVASSDEKHVGYSNTPTSVVSNTDDISWDDAAKNFIVKKAGTYECVGMLFFEGGSTLIELHVNVEGSPVNTANPRAHTTVDPVERTISAIFTCAVDDVVDITYEATSAQTTAAQIGTTVTIKRLL
jgi:hypothetical protein